MLVWPGQITADALAEGVPEPDHDGVLEAVAIGQQHDHRDDAPRDAEHRQPGTQPVAGHAIQGLAHHFLQHLQRAAHRASGA